MAKLDAFRRLLREEVRQVIREELKTFITEVRKPTANPTYRTNLQEEVRKQVIKPKQRTVPAVSNDPLHQLLNETAHEMDQSDYETLLSATSDMAQPFPQMFEQDMRQQYAPQSQVVETVSDMLANTRPTTDINQVSIDTVPDFTGLMQTMKAKGQI